jgi:hypothetical protein
MKDRCCPNTPQRKILRSIYEDARIEATANDVVRFAFTFRVQDTVGAPTNP